MVNGMMKTQFGLFVGGALSLALASCATAPIVFSGETVASTRLRNDALGIIAPLTMKRTGCKSVERLRTSILGVEGEVRGNLDGEMTSGTTRERWVASACVSEVAFLVKFTPDGQGGSYYEIEPEN